MWIYQSTQCGFIFIINHHLVDMYVNLFLDVLICSCGGQQKTRINRVCFDDGVGLLAGADHGVPKDETQHFNFFLVGDFVLILISIEAAD